MVMIMMIVRRMSQVLEPVLAVNEGTPVTIVEQEVGIMIMKDEVEEEVMTTMIIIMIVTAEVTIVVLQVEIAIDIIIDIMMTIIMITRIEEQFPHHPIIVTVNMNVKTMLLLMMTLMMDDTDGRIVTKVTIKHHQEGLPFQEMTPQRISDHHHAADLVRKVPVLVVGVDRKEETVATMINTTITATLPIPKLRKNHHHPKPKNGRLVLKMKGRPLSLTVVPVCSMNLYRTSFMTPKVNCITVIRRDHTFVTMIRRHRHLL
jgi:hypothetical protein